MASNLLISSAGLKLIPFAITFVIYFALFIPSDEASTYAAIIKCLPIISLNFFIMLHGFGFGEDQVFRKLIFYGLLFSCLGDIFLVWRDLFVLGMIAFGISHIFYIKAFGFKPLKIVYGFALFIVASIMSYVLMPGLHGVLVYGVPIYSYILATMAWRTLARLSDNGSSDGSSNRLLTAIGGVSWMMSDAFLGYHHFHSKLPYSQVLIMVTYYIGQLGIAVSILDSTGKKRVN